MKTLSFSFLAIVAVLPVQADELLPKRPDFKVYEPMMNRSPFAVATAVAAPAATPDFAKDLYVANAARWPGGDLVTIASSTDRNFKKYLSTKETVDGYSVPNIEWSERVGATRVTITKDGKYATLTFNQALIQQPLANAPGAPAMPQPNANVVQPLSGLPNGMIRPAPIPSLPPQPIGQVTPFVPPPPNAPLKRGIISRNPQPAAGVSPTPANDESND